MNGWKRPLLSAMMSGCLAMTTALAATTLYDFEDDADFADWTGYGMAIAPSPELPTHGERALAARVTAYKDGAPQWPAFELKSRADQDWNGYDRMVVDLRSASKGQFLLKVFVCDRTQPFREHGLVFEFIDPPVMGAKRYVIDLAGLPPAVDRADMALLHFFATRPPVDVDIAIDRIVLLQPGEAVEPLGTEVARRPVADTLPTPLFDFENAEDLDYWVNNQPETNVLDRVAQNATSGQWALHFFTPRFDKGVPGWPAFEYNAPAVMDWSGYDRLVFDVASPNPTPAMFGLFISDDRVPFRGALFHGQAPDHPGPMRLDPLGQTRVVVDLKRFPASVDRSRIAVLHFWTQHSPGDTHLYFDNFRLLRPGEGGPPRDPAVIAQMRRRLIDGLPPPPPATAADDADAGARPAHARAARDYRDEYQRLAADASEDADGLQALIDAARQMPLKRQRLDAIAAWENADRPGKTPFLLGRAPAAAHVFPRGRAAPVAAIADEPIRLALARRETESAQLAVLPRFGDMKKVSVAVGELRDAAGNVFPAEAVDVDVVGFVNIPTPDFNVGGDYAGWWPDPLLDWPEAVDVAAGDIQTFWLRFRCPPDQPPGLYRGEAIVAAEGGGGGTRAVGLELNVRNFGLPAHTPLPIAIGSFWHLIRQKLGAERWQKAKPDFARLFERYWIPFDHLCMTADFDILSAQHRRGLLGSFTLDYLAIEYLQEDLDAACARWVKHFDELADRADELGMLDHAVVYGFDEMSMNRAHDAGRLAAAVKAARPELFFLTTAYDKTLGAPGSPMEAFDAFAPLTTDYDPAKADAARARGKKVWWYVCVGPRPPYANFFTNSNPLDGRMLMGALTAKYRPDGFLYWALAYWGERHKAIGEWPYTNWEPRSFGATYGDGQWVFLGPDDRPVATMRLENFRDGLEDFAYFKLLEATLAAAVDDDAPTTVAWRERARAALAIPPELVRRPDSFTDDPAVLHGWREGLAAALESAPLPLADPWGPSFGPRGFGED